MATAAELARLERAQLATIADLVDSQDACIAGIVRSDHVLMSPGGGHACVAYRFRDSAGNDESRSVPFVLVDDTGEAWIEPASAILLVATHKGEGLHRSVIGAGYLRNHGHPGTHFEQSIEIGQRIYVIGSCEREVDPQAADGLYRERPPSRLRFKHTETMSLLLSDQLAPGS